MTAEQFILQVQVKLNRLDTSSYQDVRPEEVVFFANNALKALILAFDIGQYSMLVNTPAVLIYLSNLIKRGAEAALVSNEVALPVDILKFKDVQVYVTIGEEAAWCPTREYNNEKTSNREDNPFRQSYPDEPIYRLIDGQIKFDVNGFNCTKIRYDYLQTPIEITENSTLTYPFMNELEDKTVTLILENLESRRVQTQPAVSRS